MDGPESSASRPANLEVVLSHYGTRGMKWGVRQKSKYSSTNSKSDVAMKERPGKLVKTRGGKELPASEDAKKVAVSKQKARKSSTDSLSTKDLQELVNRMNLEQQYSRLDPNKTKQGAKFVGKTLKRHGIKGIIGGLKVRNLVQNDPRGQLVVKIGEAFKQVVFAPKKKKKH